MLEPVLVPAGDPQSLLAGAGVMIPGTGIWVGAGAIPTTDGDGILGGIINTHSIPITGVPIPMDTGTDITPVTGMDITVILTDGTAGIILTTGILITEGEFLLLHLMVIT
ncbi:MAG: hypothetical protein D4R67_00530 [Bacteroidetes bacterium]|nr:MAG: hypothetical protein D4R67_00530 [Bacteroidota bacterium]